jgi:2-oxoglutarate ferredoxin oxidoreductase subunit beta
VKGEEIVLRGKFWAKTFTVPGRRPGAGKSVGYEFQLTTVDGYDYIADKAKRSANLLYLEHGKPMIFGESADFGIRLNNWSPEIVTTWAADEEELLVHDERAPAPSLAFMLSQMAQPGFPEPIGVFRCVDHPTLDQAVHGQIRETIKSRGRAQLQKVLAGKDHWTTPAPVS